MSSKTYSLNPNPIVQSECVNYINYVYRPSQTPSKETPQLEKALL